MLRNIKGFHRFMCAGRRIKSVNFNMNKEQYYRNQFDFWVSLRTRWGDMDGLRHINHAAYLSYMETARLDFYQSMGYDMTRWDLEISTILASMTIDYFSQATHPTVLDIGQRITRIGNKSFDILTVIFPRDEDFPIVAATFTIVTYNYKNEETVSVPDVIKKYYRSL